MSLNLTPQFTIQEASILLTFLESRIADYDNDYLSPATIRECKGCARRREVYKESDLANRDLLCTHHSDLAWIAYIAKKAKRKMMKEEK